MADQIIPFPATAIYRSLDLVDCLEKLELCEQRLAENAPGTVNHEAAKIMLEWWEREFRAMGGDLSTRALGNKTLSFGGKEYPDTAGRA